MGKILEIKKFSDKILRQRCVPVDKITQRELELFGQMLDTMRHFSGIGLAAPQIGVNQRLLVAEVGEGRILLANPQIIKVTGKDKMEEGCLSVPGVLVDIERPWELAVKGLNEKGETVELKARGLLARVILHEIDHLNGKLIIDYMSFLEKLKHKLCSKESSTN